MRDAMHVMTAIRYGGTYFITSDKKVLQSSEQILNRFNATIICNPEDCLAKVKNSLGLQLRTQHS